MRLTRAQKALWIAAGVATLAWGGWLLLGMPTPAPASTTTVVEAVRPSFSLEDGEGRVVTDEDLRGRFLLVFFGFTNCPDVCPTTLSEVAQVMDDLGSEASQVQPIFISVDPVRDHSLGLDSYTEAFHPAILGLAGTEDATRLAAESFRVFFEREEDLAAPDGYGMAHTPDLLLIGPEGELLRAYPYGMPAADIVADLQTRL